MYQRNPQSICFEYIYHLKTVTVSGVTTTSCQSTCYPGAGTVVGITYNTTCCQTSLCNSIPISNLQCYVGTVSGTNYGTPTTCSAGYNYCQVSKFLFNILNSKIFLYFKVF
jgi:hypothetical protein